MLSSGATTAEVVEKLKVARGYVYLVKQKMKNDRPTKVEGQVKRNKNDRFHNAVVGAVVAGMEQAREGDEEVKAIRLLFPEGKEDIVNHPPHYTVGGIEVIDFIEAKQLGYNLGNVVKYVSRSGKKGTDAIQDLQKARWYLERAIQRAE